MPGNPRSHILFICFGVVHVCAAPATSSRMPARKYAGKRLAVIGAGIGGAAFSFYYANMTGAASIDVFDAHDYIGGRLKHTILGGKVGSSQIMFHYCCILAACPAC